MFFKYKNKNTGSFGSLSSSNKKRQGVWQFLPLNKNTVITDCDYFPIFDNFDNLNMIIVAPITDSVNIVNIVNKG